MLAVAVAAVIDKPAAAGVDAPSPPVLREMRWIEPGLPKAAVVRILTAEPAECLKTVTDPTVGAQIAIGRAVFRSPLLLGGQAARAGVSCASCHRGGHGNRHFAFPGVSGAPGTADVTSSLFSSRRGDGLVNPKPIPDLVADPPKIDRNPAKPDLRRFIRGLVVEEFDGLEPPAAVIDGLAAYVAALGGQCGPDAARTSASDAQAAVAAVDAARQSLALPDRPTARLLIAAARSALGRLDERFAANSRIDHRLGARDAELRQLQVQADIDPRAASAGLGRWQRRFGEDVAAFSAAEPRSLYAAAVLDRVLPNDATQKPPGAATVAANRLAGSPNATMPD